MPRNGRSPPAADSFSVGQERRFQLRRLTFRRRHERPDSERRLIERRRRSATPMMWIPGRMSFAAPLFI